VVRNIKKMVPAWNLPGHTRFNDALAAGAAQRFCPGQHRPRGHRLPAIHRRHHRHFQRGDAGSPQHHCQYAAGRAWVKPVAREGEEIIITALPLYHIFSLTANLMIFTELGALNVLITNPRDIPGFIKEIKKYRVTAITGVNTLFNALLNHPDFKTVDFPAGVWHWVAAWRCKKPWPTSGSN
jgi:long-chain acyl-CoA synthetase